MDLDALRPPAAAIDGWAREVGWRADGWAARAALGLLWRPLGTTLDTEGPCHLGASCGRRHLKPGHRAVPPVQTGFRVRRTGDLTGRGAPRSSSP
jgi:hypothetical protein